MAPKKIYYLSIYIRFDADNLEDANAQADKYVKEHLPHPSDACIPEGYIDDWRVEFLRDREEDE